MFVRGLYDGDPLPKLLALAPSHIYRSSVEKKRTVQQYCVFVGDAAVPVVLDFMNASESKTLKTAIYPKLSEAAINSIDAERLHLKSITWVKWDFL